MIFKHYSDVPESLWPWANFTPEEVACSCCGEVYVDTNALNKLQAARDLLGHAVRLTSGHRCKDHNAGVGGTEQSQHLLMAFDVAFGSPLEGDEILVALRDAGFTSFGLYETFIHCDTRPGRFWWGSHKGWDAELVSTILYKNV